jgi:aryl-alcohol dehydrogenase-like predicted oxidoreductase
MHTKQLGHSTLQLPPIMFGGNVFGWTADAATSFKLLDALVDSRLNAIDTADVYSRWVPGHTGGESEAIIGVWLKQRGGRDKIIIVTKVGMDLGAGKNGLSKARIAAAVDASLIRLQTDYIDLYQAHRDDAETPLEETLTAFSDLIKAGKIRAIGASNYTAARLKESLEISKSFNLPRYESLQPHYNLVERKIFEDELEPLCLAENIGVINYYALASGFLTGKYRAGTENPAGRRGAAAQKYLNEPGLKILAALDTQSARLHATPAQLALAWLIARPSITAPIASATSLPQLEDIVKAATLTLDKEAITALDAASAY